MKRCVHINDDNAAKNLYCDNHISNMKYTIWNFLPKNLWEQFSRFMNLYFLLIACLQLWPLITPVNPVSAWGPLIVIFAVSATKEAWDDYNRYVSDKKANEKEVWIVRHGIKTLIQAQNIRVGNIVWLHENDEVPCDLVLLGTADPHGICHVETAALDGETDLKTRVMPPASMGIDAELLHKAKGVIECPIPNKDTRRFDANMRLFPPVFEDDLCPLTIQNTLLQSCYLRNTEWACGVAVYTGNETKLGMSRGIPERKLTAVDSLIDKMTITIFSFQIVIVIVLGIAGNAWEDIKARKMWYVQYMNQGPWYDLLIIPLRFELLCSIMIPISIKVSLDVVKSLYAKFIDWDDQMVDLETGIRSHATNTAISEDLGQIEYILTDKTGTLTENKMVFKRCCVGGIFYGNENGDALKDRKLLDALSSDSNELIQFLKVMAICNTVIPIQNKSGGIMYKAQSQDELALVLAAARLSMAFVNKNGNILDIKCIVSDSLLKYEVLDILEFSSDRKRMSVVVKDWQSGKIFLFCKGADEAILPRAYKGQQISTFSEAVEQYAQLGLRTMCFAWRGLDVDEYNQWATLYKEAKSALVDRDTRVADICQELEHDFEVLGVAGIEDCLQDGVPATIGILREAGINFWMLTGDKQNTAVQIAVACNLLSPERKSEILMINGNTEDEVSRSLQGALLAMRMTDAEPKDVAFVVDGVALEIALRHFCEAFTEIAIVSRTAICCRLTPSQKAQLVELLKSCGCKTLAIGDGGNDVRMIQQANVGVGISGREGLQAARAADYSIGKFRFLERLILIHGRYSYNRTSFLSQYFFYKSLLICSIQIFFSFISGISGTSLLNAMSLMAYNVFYTSVPVIVNAIDKDLNERDVTRHPQILLYCREGRLLNFRTSIGWFGQSLFHATIVFVITFHSYALEKTDMEEVSVVALSGCIWLQAFVVALEINSFTILQHLAIWGNLVVFYAINFVGSTIPSFGMHTIMFRLCKQPSYWITMILIVAVGMGPILALKYLQYTYRPTTVNILQQAERLGATIPSLENIEPQLRSTVPQAGNSVHEPLLS